MTTRTWYCSERSCSRQWQDVGRGGACRSCKKPLTENRKLPPGHGAPRVVTDFPEHFNMSLGTVVRGRRHLKQLQKERGCQDYEPVREGPQSSNWRRQGYI